MTPVCVNALRNVLLLVPSLNQGSAEPLKTRLGEFSADLKLNSNFSSTRHNAAPINLGLNMILDL